MARDRKRAKQRRARRATSARSPGRTGPNRSDVPGALEHASSDVDEFDAALVRGADGVAATPETEEELELEAAEAAADAEEPEPEQEAELTPAPARGGGGRDGGDRGGAGGGGGGGGGGESEHAPGAPVRSGNRVLAFFRASWAELQRVQWPDRRQVTQATAVVLGFVAIAGAYLGLADFVAKEIVDFIL